jgi:serine/threonine protein kinase/Tfp pilus assembly protein PilF
LKQTPTEELTRGTTFASRYEIIEELGKGGMGRVYKVHDTEIKEKVALKLLKPEIAADERIIERFRNELKIARKVSHKRVCRMYDIGKEEEKYFITMEYVEGKDLKSLIREKGKISKNEVLKLAKQICEGLAEAHELGIVHRDLKPQNIMIDKDGNAKIMDFGIARSVEAPGVTQTGIMIGTPDYISPEQAEGAETDHRSDIYALGVILYEMVTGSVPFKGDTALSVALKHKAQLPKEPRKLNPEISEQLSRLILVCMEKDRERRYQTAEELLADLKNIEDSFPLGTKIKPRRETFATTLIRKKLFIPALVSALAIITVVIWQLLPQKKTVPIFLAKPSVAVLPFEDLSPQKDQAHVCEGMTDEVISKLSKLQGWKVSPITSVMPYKNKAKDVKKIGQELNVATILYGRLRKEKDDIRVTTQLINVEENFILWSHSYEKKIDRIFDIQSDIAEKIAKALRVELSTEEKEEFQKKPTENLEAYNIYLKGLYFMRIQTEEALYKAIAYFEHAIEKEPKYGLAYAGLAYSYSLLPYRSLHPPKDAIPKARAAATKALEVDNTIPEAHASLGLINVLSWNWEGAEREFKQAIEFDPYCAFAHHWYAIYLLCMARFDEAVKEIKLARELDPLSLVINRNVGQVFLFARHYDKAIDALQSTIEMDQNFIFSHWMLGTAYFQKGMYKEALAEFNIEKEIAKGEGMTAMAAETCIGIIYARMGNREKAKEVLKDILGRLKSAYFSPAWLALLYVALEKYDQAFTSLEKAYEVHDGWLMFNKVNPFMESIRSDPRYTKLLKKIGLEK